MIDKPGFDNRLTLRRLKLEDFRELVSLGTLCFPNMEPWKKEHIESQLRIFPEGQLVITYKNKLIASSGSLILLENHYCPDSTWAELTDDGFISNHDYEGDTLYGMEIMVHPDFRNLKLARKLYDERKKIAQRYNLKRIIIGGRIPGFREAKDKISVESYVERVIEKKLFDPVLSIQLSNGFRLKRIIRHHLEHDHESRGFATYLEWQNPHYKKKRPSAQTHFEQRYLYPFLL